MPKTLQAILLLLLLLLLYVNMRVIQACCAGAKTRHCMSVCDRPPASTPVWLQACPLFSQQFFSLFTDSQIASELAQM